MWYPVSVDELGGLVKAMLTGDYVEPLGVLNEDEVFYMPLPSFMDPKEQVMVQAVEGEVIVSTVVLLRGRLLTDCQSRSVSTPGRS